MKNIAIIFAGGSGTRMGVKDIPKQFLEVDGKPILIYTMEYFDKHKDIDEVYLVCKEDWIEYANFQINFHGLNKVVSVIPGGETGQDSIYIGLKEVKKHHENEDAIVLIHDGVRPFITKELISRCIEGAKENGNSITCTGCNETFITSTDGINVTGVPIRKESFNGQAPQTFHLDDIISAHEEMRAKNPTYENVVDSCTLYHLLGKPTYLIEGVRGNLKITNPVDVYIFKAWLDYQKSGGEVIGVPDNAEVRKVLSKIK